MSSKPRSCSSIRIHRESRAFKRFLIFFFNDTTTTEIYTLSLHDALPISKPSRPRERCQRIASSPASRTSRSEEHTSELQSPCNLVCRLLLEKKKNHNSALRRLRRKTSFALAAAVALLR